MNSNLVPISLAEFNSVFSTCNQAKDILLKFPFIRAQHKTINFKIFIIASRQLVMSYKDFGLGTWVSFLRKMQSLFHEIDFKENPFAKDIQDKANQILFNKKELAKAPTGNPVKEIIQSVISPVEDRFGSQLAGYGIEKAKNINMILNALIVEHQWMSGLNELVSSYFKEQELRKIVYRNADRVLVFDFHNKLPLFSISQAWAKKFADCSFISLYNEGEKILISLKSCFFKNNQNRNHFDPQKIKSHFEDLRASTEEDMPFLDAVLHLLELENLEKRTLEKKESLKKLSTKISPIVEHFTIKWTVFPFLSKTFVGVCQFLRSFENIVLSESIYDQMTQLSPFIDVWKEYENLQRELFEFSSYRLIQLIQDNPKINFSDAVKDFSGNFLKTYPGTEVINWGELVVKLDTVSYPKDWISLDINKFLHAVPEPQKIKKIPQEMPPQLPGQPFPYKLDPRVARWDKHPFGVALPEEEFSSFFNLRAERQQLHHIFHAPHPFVDRLFLDMGREGIIPGVIHYNGKSYFGSFEYAVNLKIKSCYHRYFTQKIKDAKALYKAEFPSLNRAEAPQFSDPVHFKEYNSSLSRDENGNVRIVDFSRDLTIELYQSRTISK